MAQNLISFTNFSKQILESGDIDPDYVFIRDVSRAEKLSKERQLDWVMRKMVIYRSVSELETMFGGKKFSEVRYGNERNKAKHHAVEYYKNLQHFFKMYSPKYLETCKNPLELISTTKGFGNWARWKLVDLLDCCLGYDIDLWSVDFRVAYEFPLKGLCIVSGLDEGTDFSKKPDTVYKVAINIAWKQMPKVKRTPHNNGRGIRMNELETCLCKYHSYVHGHYYVGKDLEHLQKDIRESELELLKKYKSWSI